MSMRIKRIYEAAEEDDGVRILVDRLWPRGLSKEKACVDHWIRDVAPSNELRKWYGHEPDKWTEFRKRYFAELDANREAVAALRAAVAKRQATLLFSSRECERNNAVALRDYLKKS